ncbi:hypothetical protein [Desulforamulus aeronauticus]|uniref:Uncharacterized protein n=1 Tax=Desulforamulus aeronauticus DSM 10349 TaxID=1121421 RepID=A0A1M6VLZ8_9FIRM|nr:hypothetical protein [Desulforamulus aeronauticus]SHK82518.1 hypothetical protein SAMN02745123_03258 [Desulforamulus aeronauticus DSM 10349]
MDIKSLDQQYIYWKYKNQWCIAKIQYSPSSSKAFLYIWQLDGNFMGMTAGKSPDTILQSRGFKMWMREGSPDLKGVLEEKAKNKPAQIELF